MSLGEPEHCPDCGQRILWATSDATKQRLAFNRTSPELYSLTETTGTAERADWLRRFGHGTRPVIPHARTCPGGGA